MSSAASGKPLHNGIGDDAVRDRTGKGWNEWFALLDGAGARKWEHRRIAEHLHEVHGMPGWWAQMVSVGYEQARGKRVKHQTAEGFSASISRTVPVSAERAFDAWTQHRRRAAWLGKDIEVTKVTKPKSIRVAMSDGTRASVMFYQRGDAKTQVAVEQTKLRSAAEVAEAKAFWKAALERMASRLEK